MGQIKNIKLHIVTDIKQQLTIILLVKTRCVSKSVTSAHLPSTQDMEFHSSEMTARCSNSVVGSAIKHSKRREIPEKCDGPKHSGNQMERNSLLILLLNLRRSETLQWYTIGKCGPRQSMLSKG